MAYDLEYDEEPHYEKFKFEFMKILLNNDQIPGSNHLDWTPNVPITEPSTTSAKLEILETNEDTFPVNPRSIKLKDGYASMKKLQKDKGKWEAKFK